MPTADQVQLFSGIGQGVGGFFAIVMLFAFAWLVYKRGVFQVQNETIAAFKTRIESLESCVKELDQKRKDDEKRIAHLEGIIKGKEEALANIVNAVAESGVCAIAFECPGRILPPQ